MEVGLSQGHDVRNRPTTLHYGRGRPRVAGGVGAVLAPRAGARGAARRRAGRALRLERRAFGSDEVARGRELALARALLVGVLAHRARGADLGGAAGVEARVARRLLRRARGVGEVAVCIRQLKCTVCFHTSTDNISEGSCVRRSTIYRIKEQQIKQQQGFLMHHYCVQN